MTSRKDEAIEAIDRVHGNTAASLEDVLADLEELAEYCNELISAIEEDISRRDQGTGNA